MSRDNLIVPIFEEENEEEEYILQSESNDEYGDESYSW